jgi:hypothetical protein
VTDPRLLALIKAKVESHDLDDEDIDLLIRLAEEAQVEAERLRRYRSLGQIPRLDLLLDERDQAHAEAERRLGLLGRLEWAGRDGLWKACPACNGRQRDGHVGIGPERAPCWLAAELRPPDPPPS